MPIKILHINEKCTGCGACTSICAKEALDLKYNKEGFYYPTLDVSKCVGCHLCEKACHVLSKPITDETDRNYTPYMIKAKDNELISKSSSGGIFSLIANKVLEDGGIVFGARYNFEKERLEYCNTDECTLDELRKSKYIESYLGNTFALVRTQLCNGRKVFFCGTPCQVKGLLTYLETRKTNTEHLITARFICHGVPSNRFFTEYKHWKERKEGSKITSFDFRPKTRGWRTSNIVLKLQNGRTIDELYQENYYYYYFQHNYLLRTCCYNCKMLNELQGDFTIADFWGIYMYDIDCKDNEGISLVLSQTLKSEDILQSIKANCNIKELPQDAIDYIYKDSESKKALLAKRAEMMREVIQIGYIRHAIKRVKKDILKFKIKNKIIKLLKTTKIWGITKR